MTISLKKHSLVFALAGVLLANNSALLLADDREESKPGKIAGAYTQLESYKAPTRGDKEPFTFKKGDAELTIGGKARIEHFFQENMNLLNSNIPDELEYFKETVDLTFDVVYGQEKYDHKAVEFFADMRHKGIWGKDTITAEKAVGPYGTGDIKFGNGSDTEAIFGGHTHSSARPIIWFKEAWLQFSLNAATGYQCEAGNHHFLKLGWFPFQLGRGIALGGYYGLTRTTLGVYNHTEDKSAPGIDLHGDIIKDRLSYDVYYSKHEERDKSLNDTLSFEKHHIIGALPWRGTGKDNDLIAGRMKWVALKNDRAVGTIEFEPYIFYNMASDQKAARKPDMKTNWGSLGLALEGNHNGFEWGGEVALNYGNEKLFNIDRNNAIIANDATGNIVEQYDKLLNMDNTKALVTSVSRRAAQQAFYVNGATIPAQPEDTSVTPKLEAIPADTYKNAPDRFRPAFKDTFDGWMAVVDGAYTFKDWNLKLAVAYGYASGDNEPHQNEYNKKYHGFMGLHESYNGKRVTSIMLDERLLKRPIVTSYSGDNGNAFEAIGDLSFSDLQHVGIGATWTPKSCIKDLYLNPNVIGFWKAHQINSFDTTTGTFSPTDKARTFMGTEINLLSKCTVVKDLALFANFAVFVPGGFFTDMTGVKLDDDFFNQNIVQDDRNPIEDASQFRLHDDVAYHINVGLEFKF